MSEHPSVYHYRQAIRHLHQAADALAGAVARHNRGEHAGALEAAKQAAGHAGQAQSHLHEAARLHALAEHESEGAGRQDNDPGARERGATQGVDRSDDAPLS